MVQDAARVATASLPIIDIAGLFSATLGARAAVAAEIRAACLDKGFFYIVGHGVEELLIQAAFEQARRLFDLPAEAGRRARQGPLRLQPRTAPRPLRGQTRLRAGAPPDLKEGFYIERRAAARRPARRRSARFNRGPQPVAGAGRLPPGDGGLDFRAMQALGDRLMRGLALSLDLPEDRFDDYLREPLATLRLLHLSAPTGPRRGGARSAGAHTDFYGLDLLMQDDEDRLQVWDARLDGWIHAPPAVGLLSGQPRRPDRLAGPTAAIARPCTAWSTPPGAERYSILFFHVGNPDHDVASLISGEAGPLSARPTSRGT